MVVCNSSGQVRTDTGLHSAVTTMRQICVSSPAWVWVRNLPCCSTAPPVSHVINRNRTFAWRKGLTGTLLTAVATAAIVLVGLEDNSYRHSQFPSSQAKSLHSKSWSQALICILGNIFWLLLIIYHVHYYSEAHEMQLS